MLKLASMMDRARRDGRIDHEGMIERLAAYGDHTTKSGPIAVVPLTRDTMATARRFVLEASIRTLDALQLASAEMVSNVSHEQVVCS